MTLRRKDIERVLTRVPPHPHPRPELEQVMTPPEIAADLAFEAFHLGDIGGRFVLDLGCGTGMLAIAAGLMGAMPVYGFDIDEGAIELARTAAREAGVSQAEFDVMDVSGMGELEAHTVLCNPPFGAQRRHADRPFIEAAAQAGRVCWTFHLAETRPWVEDRIAQLGGAVTHALPFHFPIRAQHHFHDKPVKTVDVVALRWTVERP